jgi:hypothetical protein
MRWKLGRWQVVEGVVRFGASTLMLASAAGKAAEWWLGGGTNAHGGGVAWAWDRRLGIAVCEVGLAMLVLARPRSVFVRLPLAAYALIVCGAQVHRLATAPHAACGCFGAWRAFDRAEPFFASGIALAVGWHLWAMSRPLPEVAS